MLEKWLGTLVTQAWGLWRRHGTLLALRGGGRDLTVWERCPVVSSAHCTDEEAEAEKRSISPTCPRLRG